MHTLQDNWLSMQAPILIRQINYTYAWNLCEKDVGGSWGQWRGRRSPWSSPLLSLPHPNFSSFLFYSRLNCLRLCNLINKLSTDQLFWSIGQHQLSSIQFLSHRLLTNWLRVRFNGLWTFANRLLTNGQCNIHLKNALTNLLDICTAWSTSESISVYM